MGYRKPDIPMPNTIPRAWLRASGPYYGLLLSEAWQFLLECVLFDIPKAPVRRHRLVEKRIRQLLELHRDT